MSWTWASGIQNRWAQPLDHLSKATVIESLGSDRWRVRLEDGSEARAFLCRGFPRRRVTFAPGATLWVERSPYSHEVVRIRQVVSGLQPIPMSSPRSPNLIAALVEMAEIRWKDISERRCPECSARCPEYRKHCFACEHVLGRLKPPA